MNNDLRINSESTCVTTLQGRVLSIKEQRGRKYVNFEGKQVNVKDILLEGEPDLNTKEGWQQLYDKNILNYNK